MERVETAFVFASACHKHLADITPGALVNSLVNTDVVVDSAAVVKVAIRRKARASACKPWHFPTLIPSPNRDLVPEPQQSGLVVLVEIVDVKTAVVALDLAHALIAPMLFCVTYAMAMSAVVATVEPMCF